MQIAIHYNVRARYSAPAPHCRGWDTVPTALWRRRAVVKRRPRHCGTVARGAAAAADGPAAARAAANGRALGGRRGRRWKQRGERGRAARSVVPMGPRAGGGRLSYRAAGHTNYIAARGGAVTYRA